MAEPAKELVENTISAVREAAGMDGLAAKDFQRPKVKLVWDIIYNVSQRHGFPRSDEVVEKEMPKELK